MSHASKAPTIWSESGWPEYYETHRVTTKDVYASEWFFLKDLLVEGVSVLDIGCAVGGLAAIIAEHVRVFEYTGVDISEEMIRRARVKHPSHTFHVIPEADLSALGDRHYDVVVCLGALHLSRLWREMIAAAWERTVHSLVLDLRQSHGPTIEDPAISSFRVGFLLDDETPPEVVLPYNIINAADGLATMIERCPGAARLQTYGYLAPPSPAAVTPVTDVQMATYRIDRAQ